MRIMKPSTVQSILACGLMLAVLDVLGIVPRTLVAAESSENIGRLLKANDFWSQTGVKQKHDTFTAQDVAKLRELAGVADSSIVRIRAYKVLADLTGRARYSNDISEQQSHEAVEAAFRHLEQRLPDDAAAKFRPELGFTHVSLSKRSNDQDGIWVLIEFADGVLPSGGLNIRWNPTTKAVDKVEHWGANRTPAL